MEQTSGVARNGGDKACAGVEGEVEKNRTPEYIHSTGCRQELTIIESYRKFFVTVKLGFYIFNLKIFYFCPEGGRVS